MPIGTISTMIEKGVPGVMEAPSINWGGPTSSAKVPLSASQVSPSRSQSAVLTGGCRQVASHVSMPMVATLYYHDNGTVPPFVSPTLHKVRNYDNRALVFCIIVFFFV